MPQGRAELGLSHGQRLATAVALLLALAAAIFWCTTLLIPKGTTPASALNAQHSEPTAPKLRPPEFFKGNPPDLVLMLSGQMYGYLQPCGCARPQLGGLERRWELLNQLSTKGIPVSAADLGELAPKQTDRQGRMKFETALHTLHLMNYAALGVGVTEAAMPLSEAFDTGLNYQPPFFLAANLIDKNAQFPEMFRPCRIDSTPHLPFTVGYVGVAGNSVIDEARKKDSTLTFAPVEEVLPKMLEQMKAAKTDVLVLLLQGSRAEGKNIAGQFPQFRVVLTLDDSDEPSALPDRVGDTLLISVGHKGKYVGLVGVYRQPETGRLDLRYELAGLSEGFEPPDDATNPARERMRDYVRGVYEGDFLTKWPRSSHPLQLDFPDAKYVGAAKCQQCHRKAFAIWSNARHYHAYETLEKAGRPIATSLRDKPNEPPGSSRRAVGRQHDPECVRCHTTGFDYKTGYVTEDTTPHLKGNQCENCHGPASLHVEHPQDGKYSVPLRLTIAKADNLCRKCHDGDNDPKFKLEEYWEKIRHGRE